MGTPRVENFGRQDCSQAADIEEDLDDYFMKISCSSQSSKSDQDSLHLTENLKA